MKHLAKIIVGLAGIFILISGCSAFDTPALQNVGMLVEYSIHDEGWSESGYDGLISIQDNFDTDVYYKENVRSQIETNRAVDEFASNGVNLIFGHGYSYGKYFQEIAEEYPDVQFIYFNGGYASNNVTSFNFNSHAMGFFGGMIAGTMTHTNNVGIVSAFEWQPEIEGFYEGVKYQNPNAEVLIKILNDWNDTSTANDVYENLKEQSVDVFYPTGDLFSEHIIKRAESDGLYAIGFVNDQSSIAEDTVLTSTIQHVDKLYLIAASQMSSGELQGGIKTFDFKDEAISLGEFHRDVPEYYQAYINKAVDEYIETGILPNERR